MGVHRRRPHQTLLGLISAVATLGPAQAQSGSIEIADLLEVAGDSAFDQFGASLAAAGDVDADGFDDLVAASRFGGDGPGSPSYVRVISGRSGEVLHELRGDSSAETLFGVSLASAGDVNNDGLGDIIIGSPNPDPSAPIFGKAYVFSGADGTVLHRFVEADFNEDFGRAVAGVGDVDGDGSDDVVIGAPKAAFSRGAVQLRSGASGAILLTFFGVGGEELGQAVSNIGDVNNDGTPDVLIGSPGGIRGSCPACVRVYSGFDGTPLLTITNGDPESKLGASVASAGDVNGDGVPDIIAGAPSASIVNQGDGAAYVYSGANGDQIFRWTDRVGLPFPSNFAASVAGGGDIDGDGFWDIVVGAPLAQGASNGLIRGRIYAYSGRDGALLFRASGRSNGDSFGSGASIIGDANGDGFADVAAGAQRAGGSGMRNGSVRAVRRMAASGGVLCFGEPNSTGVRSTVDARSTTSFEAAANDLSLEVSSLPVGVIGFFIVSQTFNVLPEVGGSAGRLCIAGFDVGRYSASLSVSTARGEVGFVIDNTSIPLPSGGTPGVKAQPGDTFNFQFWHRDTGVSGAPSSNLSDGVTITFR